jgi:hypothetical protein
MVGATQNNTESFVSYSKNLKSLLGFLASF